MRTHRTPWKRFFAAAGVLALVAAACGDDDGDDGDDGAAPAEEPSGEVSLAHNWTGSELDAFEAVVDGFEEAYPDVSVELVQVPFEEMNAQIPQQFSAGSAPDVTVALPGLMRLLVEGDFIAPVDDLWDGWIEDGQYTDSLREIATVDGTTYGVWFKANVNGLIWYRPDTFQALGVQPAQTWDDFVGALDAARAAGTAPVAVGGADQWPLTQWSDSILAAVAGPEVFNGLVDGSVSWDDERVVQAFEVFGQLIADYFPDTALDLGFVEETCTVMDGNALVQNQGAFVSLVAPGECDESLVPGEDFAFFPLPAFDQAGEDTQFISGDLFVLNADTDNETAARALLEHLGSADAQQVWAERGGFIAPNADVPLDVYPTETDRQAAELWPAHSGAVAVYDLDDAIGGEIQNTEREALQQFVRDQDVEAFISTMVDVTNEARGG
jgi:alpha-glucoside transport system substrate-binding protein